MSDPQYKYGIVNERPATAREWVIDSLRDPKDRKVTDGPTHIGGDNCLACKTLMEYIDDLPRQDTPISRDELKVARLVYRTHSRVGPADDPDGDSINMCDCEWCWHFRQYMVFHFFFQLETEEELSHDILEQLQGSAARIKAALQEQAAKMQERAGTATTDLPGMYL